MPFNEIEISNQPVTGIRRKVRRFQTVTHEDGEISIIIKVIFLDENSVELVNKFRSMIGPGEGQITQEQFNALEKRYDSYYVEHHTRGSFVNPLTGELVPVGTEGAVPEIEWLRSLSVANHLIPMLVGGGYLEQGNDNHIAIEEAFERYVMQLMDTKKRY
jgi:hypothetical protein